MSKELNLQMEIGEVDFPNLFNFLSSESNQILRTRQFCVLAENALLGLVQNANGETSSVETPRAESPIAIETPKVETNTLIEQTPIPVRPRGSFAESFQFES